MAYRLTDSQGLLAFEMRRQGATIPTIARALGTPLAAVDRAFCSVKKRAFYVPEGVTSATISAEAERLLLTP